MTRWLRKSEADCFCVSDIEVAVWCSATDELFCLWPVARLPTVETKWECGFSHGIMCWILFYCLWLCYSSGHNRSSVLHYDIIMALKMVLTFGGRALNRKPSLLIALQKCLALIMKTWRCPNEHRCSPSITSFTFPI